MAPERDAQDSELRVQRRRPARIPREALRERVLDEGTVLLAESGVTPSLYHLNVEELIRRVGVPRSSVFAAFGGKDELITELMVQLLHSRAAADVEGSWGTADLVREVLAQHGHRMRRPDGSRDLAGEHAVLREVVRLALAYNTEEFAGTSKWHTFMALSASVDSLPEGRRERVVTALCEADAAHTAEMSAFYCELAGAVGRRMRPGLEWRHIVSTGSGLVESTIARRRFGAPEATETLWLPGLDGEPVEWTLVAASYLAMIESMTEPVPLPSA